MFSRNLVGEKDRQHLHPPLQTTPFSTTSWKIFIGKVDDSKHKLRMKPRHVVLFPRLHRSSQASHVVAQSPGASRQTNCCTRTLLGAAIGERSACRLLLASKSLTGTNTIPPNTTPSRYYYTVVAVVSIVAIPFPAVCASTSLLRQLRRAQWVRRRRVARRLRPHRLATTK